MFGACFAPGEPVNLLVLGRSRFFTRRMAPALREVERIAHVDVASRRPQARDAHVRATFDDYAAALEASDAELVYVSLVNAHHAAWAERALRAGRHVVVDKPLTTSLPDAERLLSLAARRKRCLAELNTFGMHPMVSQALDDVAGDVRRVVATFSFPPLPADDFRWSCALGGGVIEDLGPYAAAVARVVLPGAVEELTCRVGWRDGVPTSLSLLATVGEATLLGGFGFGSVYENRLAVIASERSVFLERAFTQPPDIALSYERRDGLERSTVTVEAANSFGVFFERLLDTIEASDFGEMHEVARRDAQLLHRMRTCAGQPT